MKSAAGWKVYGGVLLILGACTALAGLMRPHFDSAGLTMVYLLGVVVIATAFGRAPAVVAAVLSVATFDFAFVPPRFTFRVSDAQYLVVLAVMLAVAVITGTLTARLRDQREAARQGERRTAALYRLTHDLAVRSGAREVLQAAVDRIAEMFGTSVAASVAVGDRNTLEIMVGDASVLEAPPDRAAAEWAYANGQPAGILSRIPADAQGVHVPLVAGARTLGVISLGRIDPKSLDQPERWELLRALSGQTALAMERCRLAEDAERARGDVEAERMRSALLSSISHDLRTPLAAITGAASSLRSEGDSLPAAARRELSEAISEEAARLNRVIGNLLDMTRVESGTLRVKKEWHSVEEIVGAALARLEPQLAGREVRVSLPADLPLVPTDDVLLETVVRNLVENAAKYSPSQSPLEVVGMIEGEALRLDVADRGAGLVPGEERRVFEKFYRGEASRALQGVGLGLAIVKGIVEAHEGSIEAVNRSGGGTVFTVRIPLDGTPPPFEGDRLDSPGSSGRPS
jgi:two-component system sensor histidine kinase KdpD